MLRHKRYEKMKTRPPKIKNEAKENIVNFYDKDGMSRVLPYKNKVLKIKNKNIEVKRYQYA